MNTPTRGSRAAGQKTHESRPIVYLSAESRREESIKIPVRPTNPFLLLALLDTLQNRPVSRADPLGRRARGRILTSVRLLSGAPLSPPHYSLDRHAWQQGPADSLLSGSACVPVRGLVPTTANSDHSLNVSSLFCFSFAPTYMSSHI